MCAIAISNCPVCGRDFMWGTKDCGFHCTPSCCRNAGCQNAKPPARRPEARDRKCVVCGRSNRRFPWERFAPCDEHCDRLFFHTPAPSAGGFVRGWHCIGAFADPGDWTARSHRPAATPRRHKLYCSLRCYYHSTLGHDVRMREGRARRRKKYLSSLVLRTMGNTRPIN